VPIHDFRITIETLDLEHFRISAAKSTNSEKNLFTKFTHTCLNPSEIHQVTLRKVLGEYNLSRQLSCLSKSHAVCVSGSAYPPAYRCREKEDTYMDKL